jgi:DCN1-like protein 1/2
MPLTNDPRILHPHLIISFQWSDKDSDEITIDGTFSFCEALEVDPGDVVLLAIAYELKSPRMGHWTRQGWIEGWKHIGRV